MASRAMLSSPPPLPCPGVIAAPRPTSSMARHSCAHSGPSSEPRVCSMVVAPSPEEEDRRRISRERRTLSKERIEHVNRIKGLLASQGIFGCEPTHKDFRARLAGLRTGDGRPLGPRLKAEIIRELERLDLVLRQIATVEAERDALVQSDVIHAEAPA